MTRILWLALGLVLFAPPPALHAQQPLQSLSPTQTACGPGSQSLRVCQNDIVSCNSVCNARALDASADIAGCGTRCCVQFNTCLRLRGCGARIIDCD